MGRTAVLTEFPIKVAMGTAMTVEIKPLIAAPIPAMDPKRCMASDLIFPERKPMGQNWKIKNIIKIVMLGFLSPECKTVYNVETISERIINVMTNFFIPNLTTSIPLVNVAKPTDSAKAPNMYGNSAIKLY